jgi:hypothetical protein
MSKVPNLGQSIGIIQRALAVLGVFGVEDRETAEKLLDMWTHRAELTLEARSRVLDVLFDADHLQPMYQPCPSWCKVRHDEPEIGRFERMEMLREHRREVLRTSGQAPHHRDITIDVTAADSLEDGHRDGPDVAIHGAEFLTVEKALVVSAGLVRACEIIEGETP